MTYNGVLRVFARGLDSALWQAYFSNGAWTWQKIGGGITSSPSALIYNDILRVFARGEDGALWQDFWNGSTWTWQDLGGGIN